VFNEKYTLMRKENYFEKHLGFGIEFEEISCQIFQIDKQAIEIT